MVHNCYQGSDENSTCIWVLIFKIGLLYIAIIFIMFIIIPKRLSLNTSVLRSCIFGVTICITELKTISTAVPGHDHYLFIILFSFTYQSFFIVLISFLLNLFPVLFFNILLIFLNSAILFPLYYIILSCFSSGSGMNSYLPRIVRNSLVKKLYISLKCCSYTPVPPSITQYLSVHNMRTKALALSFIPRIM